jgi:uncharacterized membrane protein YkvA (DUF1232 family)
MFGARNSLVIAAREKTGRHMIPITIELDDQDLEHFRRMFAQAEEARTKAEDELILRGARGRLEEAASAQPPRFLRERLDGLRQLVDMAEDRRWRLPDPERRRVVSALAYFMDPDDLIPDRIPGLGFLDDAIAAELVLRELAHETESYREFCAFREAESQRRVHRGLSPDVDKEDWLADKRATLHHRMRERKASEPVGWRYTLFG